MEAAQKIAQTVLGLTPVPVQLAICCMKKMVFRAFTYHRERLVPWKEMFIILTTLVCVSKRGNLYFVHIEEIPSTIKISL